MRKPDSPQKVPNATLVPSAEYGVDDSRGSQLALLLRPLNKLARCSERSM